MKRRLTWNDVQPFPGNPIYEGRLLQMRREWGGYDHSNVGAPAIFDNSARAFPDFSEDTLFIGDGNHRRELARRDKQLDCEFLADLYRGLSRPEMFRQRRGLNDRRTVKPSERFLAHAEENRLGDEQLIKAAVEGLGWRITYEREAKGLPCVNELTWIWKRDKGAMIRAIQSYEAAFGVNPAKAQAAVIKGLGDFWMKYPDADPDRLVKSLKGVSVKELYEAGRLSREQLTWIRTAFAGVRYALAMGYNRAGRKEQLAL